MVTVLKAAGVETAADAIAVATWTVTQNEG